jgi:hypothetical protein
VTRRLRLGWPDERPFRHRDRRAIRILAASDEADPALDHAANREALGPLDLIVGCGDLEPDRLAFLADAFRSSPLVYVRGNHDRGGPWAAPDRIPSASTGIDRRSIPGAGLVLLPWPGRAEGTAVRDDGAAWGQVLATLGPNLILPSTRPWLVVSHVPPRGAGDSPEDPYHAGFASYRWVLDRLRPRLWLHGHTAMAAVRDPVVEHGPTTVVNVTGSVLIELLPPEEASRDGQGRQ